jgi:hypothetical protein
MTAKDGPPDGLLGCDPAARTQTTDRGGDQANRGPDKMPLAMASNRTAPTDRANSHNPKPASMLGTSGLHRGPWASGEARHEADQITTIVQPLIIDWSILSGI